MLGHHPSRQDNEAAAVLAAHHNKWLDAIRELRTGQFYHYQWHVLRLDGGGRGRRSGGSASSQRAFAERIDSPDTVILGCFVDAHMRGAAEIRPLAQDESRGAEIALSVESAWQGRGIGTALMAAVVCAARERGVARLYLRCHVLHRRVQRIAE